MNPYNIVEIENLGFDTDLITGYYLIEKDLFDGEEAEPEIIKQLIILYGSHQLTVDDPEGLILEYIRTKIRKEIISKENLKSSDTDEQEKTDNNNVKPIKRKW